MARRAAGKIDKLPNELKYTVEQMLLIKAPYSEIVEYLASNEVQLSAMTVCRYAKHYLGALEQLKFAQENMRMILSEMENYPNLDCSEAILRMASQNIFNAIIAVPKEKWEGIDPEKLLNQATGLIRAASSKRKTDAQLKTDNEAALEANQALLFEVLAKEYPGLYKQVVAVIHTEKQTQEE